MEKWKENKLAYNKQYAKDNFKRIPLDVQKTFYEEIKAAADAAGESVNGYIKEAIKRRMESDAETAGKPQDERKERKPMRIS